jgi:hypothetical protein
VALTLLTIAEIRALIRTDLDDTQLTSIAAREEAMLVSRLGPHGDGVSAVTATATAAGGDLFLYRPVVSITSVGGTVWASLSTLTLYPAQGRIAGGRWDGAVAVVYIPADDREERRAALIDLIRLTLERTAMKGESVAGEYSYSAPDWEAERRAIYRRLMFTSL